MTVLRFNSVIAAGVFAAGLAGGAMAQDEQATPAVDVIEEAVVETVIEAAPEASNAQPEAATTPSAEATSTEATPPTEPAEPEINEDEMADLLNSQQQLQQSFTFTRKIDGEVVETETRTITYTDDDPLRSTEANRTALEELKAAFDGEVLTRTEAFEEAKVDYVIADADRDGIMTQEEFADLVMTWLENDPRQPAAPTKEIARQRQYQAFLNEIDPEAARLQAEARAKQKFAFMTGAATGLSQKDYIAEYLVDFDAMDANKDMLLKDDELLKFRALNRGETVEM